MSTALLTSPVFAEVTRVDIVCPGPHIYGECCSFKCCLPWGSHLSFNDKYLYGVCHCMGTWDETMTCKTISFQMHQRAKQNWPTD